MGFNAGTNIGALVTSVTEPWITIQFGRKWAFLIAGGVGLLWVIAWDWRGAQRGRTAGLAESPCVADGRQVADLKIGHYRDRHTQEKSARRSSSRCSG
ncbi:MAG: hypothetical protein WAN12_18050 [Candidatus Acidiferrum sp.]